MYFCNNFGNSMYLSQVYQVVLLKLYFKLAEIFVIILSTYLLCVDGRFSKIRSHMFFEILPSEYTVMLFIYVI